MSTQMQSSSKSLLGITADWHMVENDWSGRSQLGGDAEFGLYQVTKYAREQHLPLLAAGDLFSSRTPGRDMMIKTSSYLSGVDGYYIQGNHDKLYPSWMKLVARHWAHLEEQPVELVPEPKDLFAAARDERLILESEPLFTEDRTWLACLRSGLPDYERTAPRGTRRTGSIHRTGHLRRPAARFAPGRFAVHADFDERTGGRHGPQLL